MYRSDLRYLAWLALLSFFSHSPVWPVICLLKWCAVLNDAFHELGPGAGDHHRFLLLTARLLR